MKSRSQYKIWQLFYPTRIGRSVSDPKLYWQSKNFNTLLNIIVAILLIVSFWAFGLYGVFTVFLLLGAIDLGGYIYWYWIKKGDR